MSPRPPGWFDTHGRAESFTWLPEGLAPLRTEDGEEFKPVRAKVLTELDDKGWDVTTVVVLGYALIGGSWAPYQRSVLYRRPLAPESCSPDWVVTVAEQKLAEMLRPARRLVLSSTNVDEI